MILITSSPLLSSFSFYTLICYIHLSGYIVFVKKSDKEFLILWTDFFLLNRLHAYYFSHIHLCGDYSWSLSSARNLWYVNVLIYKVPNCFSHVQLFATLWTLAHQAPLSMGYSRSEYWNALPLPSPGDLPNPGIESVSLRSPALTSRLFITSTTWEALMYTIEGYS